jgi:hypothetical protein
MRVLRSEAAPRAQATGSPLAAVRQRVPAVLVPARAAAVLTPLEPVAQAGPAAVLTPLEPPARVWAQSKEPMQLAPAVQARAVGPAPAQRPRAAAPKQARATPPRPANQALAEPLQLTALGQQAV